MTNFVSGLTLRKLFGLGIYILTYFAHLDRWRNGLKETYVPSINESGIIAVSVASFTPLQALDETLSKLHPWLENSFMGNLLLLMHDHAINSAKKKLIPQFSS